MGNKKKDEFVNAIFGVAGLLNEGKAPVPEETSGQERPLPREETGSRQIPEPKESPAPVPDERKKASATGRKPDEDPSLRKEKKILFRPQIFMKETVMEKLKAISDREYVSLSSLISEILEGAVARYESVKGPVGPTRKKKKEKGKRIFGE